MGGSAICLWLGLWGATALVEVQTATGPLSAEIDSWNARELVVHTESGSQTVPTAELHGVKLGTRSAPSGDAVRVYLRDESELPVSAARTAGKELEFEFLGKPCSAPLAGVKGVRFLNGAEHAPLDAQWREFWTTTSADDTLVVLKNDHLDSLSGKILELNAERVILVVDDEKLTVKRSKVFGIIWGQRDGGEGPEPVAKGIGVEGWTVLIQDFELKGGELALKTPAGAALSIPLNALAEVRFDAVRERWLSELEPMVKTEPSDQPGLAVLGKYDGLLRDRTRGGESLSLGEQTFAKGLCLIGKTSVEYRLAGKYQRLQATIGLDDAVQQGGGAVRLKVVGDERSLWEGTVEAGKTPLSLDVNLSGVRRLEFVAAPLPGHEFGNWLDLGAAKVIK